MYPGCDMSSLQHAEETANRHHLQGGWPTRSGHRVAVEFLLMCMTNGVSCHIVHPAGYLIS
jgi:hypothetical protein